MKDKPQQFTIVFFGDSGQVAYVHLWSTRAKAENTAKEFFNRPEIYGGKTVYDMTSVAPAKTRFVPARYEVCDGWLKTDPEFLVALRLNN